MLMCNLLRDIDFIGEIQFRQITSKLVAASHSPVSSKLISQIAERLSCKRSVAYIRPCGMQYSPVLRRLHTTMEIQIVLMLLASVSLCCSAAIESRRQPVGFIQSFSVVIIQFC